MGISYFLLLSCVGLFTHAQAQNCSRPVLGENMDLRGTNILLQSFANGTKVSLSCNLGYTPAQGRTFITCTAGSWSPVTLICERRSCGSAGEVLNGDVQYPTGNEFGDKAIIVCNTGYRLVGKGERLCGVQDWEGRLPRCEVVTCDPPPAIVDGTQDPVKDVYDYKDVVQYSCNRGLTLIGSSTISCSADEQFNPSPPQCKKVECPDREVVNGEWVQGSRPPHVYQATMTFQCNRGFKIQGQETIKCGSDNLWSPEPPLCEAVTCPPPSNVDHGSFSPDKTIYQYDDVVKYSCDAGYEMTGSDSRSCSQSGTFTSVPPTCISKTTTGRPTTTTATINVAPPKTEENSGNHVKVIVGVFVGLLVIFVACFFGYRYLKKTSSVKQRDGERVTDDEAGKILSHPSES